MTKHDKPYSLLDWRRSESLWGYRPRLVYDDTPKAYKSNKAQCKLCGDVVESKHRHDNQSCKCHEIFVDGGLDYLRRGAKNLDNIVELSEENDDK